MERGEDQAWRYHSVNAVAQTAHWPGQAGRGRCLTVDKPDLAHRQQHAYDTIGNRSTVTHNGNTSLIRKRQAGRSAGYGVGCRNGDYYDGVDRHGRAARSAGAKADASGAAGGVGAGVGAKRPDAGGVCAAGVSASRQF